jgi:hypothetical protein
MKAFSQDFGLQERTDDAEHCEQRSESRQHKQYSDPGLNHRVGPKVVETQSRSHVEFSLALWKRVTHGRQGWACHAICGQARTVA